MIGQNLRTEWDRLVAKMAAAEDALPFGLPDDHELLLAHDAISSELDECARLIIKQPSTNLADIRLLAEACYWAQYGEGALDAPDAFLVRETSDLADATLAALLRAIRGVVPAQGESVA